MIAIVDYGCGNLFSLTSSVNALGLDTCVTGDADKIRNADRIMYIDKGKIMESGTHDALMEKKGYYYKLYTSQYME